MNGFRPQAEPPRTLAERLEQLNDNLQTLGGRLKDAIASAVSTAVAEAIHDVMRNLLGTGELPSRDDRFDQRREPESGSLWTEPEEAQWPEEDNYLPGQREAPEKRKQTPSRWRDALGFAVKTGLWWMKKQPRQRPVLTTVAVATVAGVTAFIAGPAFAAGVGVLASAASLIMSANGLGCFMAG